MLASLVVGSHNQKALAARLVGVAAACATVVACSELAGINDSPTLPPSNTPPTAGKDASASAKPTEDRSDANIKITPGAGDMDLGEAACGDSVSQVITIQNLGDAATTYNVAIPENTAFTIEGSATGPVAARGIVSLKVIASPLTAGESFTDMVVSAGNAVQSMHPKVRGAGATFELTPSVLDFGDVRMQSGAGPIDIEITNKGTVAALLSSFEQSPDFAVAFDPAPLTVAAGGKALLHVTFNGAQAESLPLVKDLKPGITQKLCGAVPLLTLKGKRVNSSVTLSSGDFGRRDCLTQGALDISVSNYSATVLGFTASLPAASLFTIASGMGPGSILGGTTTTPTKQIIKVQPKAPYSAANLAAVLQDTLSIAITGVGAPDGGPRSVALRADVRGAILTIAPTQIIDFVSDSIVTDSRNYTVQNTGNERVYLYWDFARTVGGPAWSYNPPSSVDPGQTRTSSIGFKPDKTNAVGAHEGKLTPYRTTDFFGKGARVCNPPLTQILVQGSKTATPDAGQ